LGADLTGCWLGQFQITLGGERGCVLQIETSGDLRNWTPLILVTNLMDILCITDYPTNLSRQFYRARQWP
jgi:hypothetical protein